MNMCIYIYREREIYMYVYIYIYILYYVLLYIMYYYDRELPQARPSSSPCPAARRPPVMCI